MALTLQIQNAAQTKASVTGTQAVELCYRAPYQSGDAIVLETTEPCYLMLRIEDSLAPTFVYLTGRYCLPIPFGADRVSYSPKAFAFDTHFLSARLATAQEIAAPKNLCLNAYDHHTNTAMFPHAVANVETRNEAVFAARNAIDGICAAGGHGDYPYQSWGINQQADAQLTVSFGRSVNIETVGITLRSDFPHDNWWPQVTLQFSDGSRETLSLQKTAQPQYFALAKQGITHLTICEMQKDASDPSPFPALMQLEAFGV